MTIWGIMRRQLRGTAVFFAIFLGFGVGMDMLIRQTPINWVERVVVALVATAAYAVMTALMARRKAGEAGEGGHDHPA